MRKKYISTFSALFIMAMSLQAATPGAMRNADIQALAAYTAPQTTPARCTLTFMPDGKQSVERSADGKKLILKDIATGKETGELFDLGHTRETVLTDFEGFKLSPDASKILVWRNSSPIYRRSFSAQYYVYEVRSRLLKPLSKTHQRQRDPLFSPDSRMVAFVADNNIHIAKLDYETEVAVTEDGAINSIINGATDWTYEEEFEVTSLMTWAPDNLTFCYVRFDESAVPMYTLPVYEGTCDRKTQYELYPGVMSYKYPVAGEPNSTVSLHSYDVETRKTKTVDLPGNPEYIARLAYGPKPSQLMVSTLNRDQNRFELFMANPKSTVTRSVFTEESKAWILPEMYSELHFGENSFVIADDASGFTRFYEYSYSGAKIKDISGDNYDATEYYGSDALGNHYFQAAAPTPMDRTVYRLDKKGIISPISSTEGTSSASFAPGNAFMLLQHNDITTPPVYSINRSDGKELRVIVDNKEFAAKTKGLLAKKEFFKMQSDGNELNGYMVKPVDFDPSRRYPVIMSQYSGPGSQTVLNRWSLDWESYYASKGYIIICVDGRGTAGRGTAFRTSVYKRLGYFETIDQLAAARYAAALPYVDAKKIGIYGWSYGGFEALKCATADECPFAAAVAVAPVTDYRFYDTVYTERYMLTPQQNEKGYNETSVLLRAHYLGCPLLIMYGTADDNVHPANSIQFVSALESAGILCDMLIFPNMNHSINGCNARQVVYGKMLQYFDSKLK